MNRPVLCTLLLATMVGCTFFAFAQQQTSTSVIVPRLIRFGGVLKDSSGKPLQGKAGITFGLYKDQDGGAALWLETQNVSLDANGHYSVLLGATKEEGVPMDLFTSGAAQWLGVQVQGQPEQPRVLLVSVPYALKAADAETLGGLPPSAFAPSPKPSTTPNPASAAPSAVAATGAVTTLALTGSGAPNFVPLWTSSSNLGNSTLSQVSGNVGIGYITPLPSGLGAKLDVKGSGIFRGTLTLPASGTATASLGFKSQPLDLFASVFKSSTASAVAQHFRWQAEPVNNDSAFASGALNLLFASGTATPTETGLSISSDGSITSGGSIVSKGKVFGVHGVFGDLATGFGGLAQFRGPVEIGQSLPSARLDVAVPGTGMDALVGDAQCGPNFAGIAFLPNGTGFSTCTNYTLLGNGTDTFVNRPAGGAMHFREGNGEEMTLFSGGGLYAASGVRDSIHGTSHTVNGSGVTGINDAGNVGMYAAATGSTGQGLFAESFASAGNANGGADGVHGLAHTNAGSGVAGINNAIGGTGVFGSAPSGYGMVTDSNVQQARAMGGWVKAMAVIDETISPVGPKQIVSCYNSQISGAAASTPPCGFTMTAGGLGIHDIDFGFQVSDRFIQATPVFTLDSSNTGGVLLNIFVAPSSNPNRVRLITHYNGSGDDTDTTVYVMVF